MLNRKEIVGLALGILLLLPVKSFASDLFSPFQTSDWAGMGLTAVADFRTWTAPIPKICINNILGYQAAANAIP